MGNNVANHIRGTQYDDKDPSGDKTVRKFARQILAMVNDPRMNGVIAVKVARALYDRRLSGYRLTEIINSMRSKGAAIKSRGAYFTKSIQAEFSRLGIAWSGDDGKFPKNKPKENLFDLPDDKKDEPKKDEPGKDETDQDETGTN